MNERFELDWVRQAEPIVTDLIEIVASAEKLLIDAFSICADSSLQAKTISDVKSNLRMIIGIGRGIPWVFYDTIATLVTQLPKGTRAEVLNAVHIETGHPHECLTVTEDGRWQLAWSLTGSHSNQHGRVALDWYKPPFKDESPIVPAPIIDYIAGCIALLNGNLVLPAAAVLSIALEAVLWDALASKGISRHTEKIEYKTVEWQMQKRSSKLVVTINGADKDLSSLGEVTGNYPGAFTLQTRRLHRGEGQQRIILQVEADASLLDHLTTSQEGSRESSAQHGLSVAIQRARKEEIESLKAIPIKLDTMLIRLRNNLIHLIPEGSFNEPIPTLEGRIEDLSELRASKRLIGTLLPWIIELINSVYSRQFEPGM
jgi:hypothetical protein